MKTISEPGLEMIGLEVRSLNGHDALFTKDGALLSNQIEGSGYIYYDASTGQRHKTFRVTFLFDRDNVVTGVAYEGVIGEQNQIDPDSKRQAGR